MARHRLMMGVRRVLQKYNSAKLERTHCVRWVGCRGGGAPLSRGRPVTGMCTCGKSRWPPAAPSAAGPTPGPGPSPPPPWSKGKDRKQANRKGEGDHNQKPDFELLILGNCRTDRRWLKHHGCGSAGRNDIPPPGNPINVCCLIHTCAGTSTRCSIME